jgi:hypothetical protein
MYSLSELLFRFQATTVTLHSWTGNSTFRSDARVESLDVFLVFLQAA